MTPHSPALAKETKRLWNRLRNVGWTKEDCAIIAPMTAEINRLKKEQNAVILAHSYMTPDLMYGIADFVGDSYGLSIAAKSTSAQKIIFCSVHFMAETAKILSPHKKVLLPDLNAGCSLADSCSAESFSEFIDRHPGHVVISYVNCSAAVKTLTDIVCTSTNAVQIIESIPLHQPIIFAPDKNLGKFLIKKTGRDMVLWEGSCIVHEIFSVEKIAKLQMRHPAAKLIAHPECEDAILERADFIGSTTALLRYTEGSGAEKFIVATESGIIHQMEKKSPHKTFIPAPPNNACACNDCPHMKLNTLEKIYLCMKHEQPEILLDAALIEKAKQPIKKMLEISAKHGLVSSSR